MDRALLRREEPVERRAERRRLVEHHEMRGVADRLERHPRRRGIGAAIHRPRLCVGQVGREGIDHRNRRPDGPRFHD